MVGSLSGRLSASVCFGLAKRRLAGRNRSLFQRKRMEKKAEETKWRKKRQQGPPACPVPGVFCLLRRDSKCVGVCH